MKTINEFFEDRKLRAFDIAMKDLQRISNRVLEDLIVANKVPYFNSIHVTHSGHIWVSLYRKRSFADDWRFLIFSPEGKLVAQATMPGGWYLEPWDIDDDSMLLYDNDEDYNHRLKVVAIRRPPGSKFASTGH